MIKRAQKLLLAAAALSVVASAMPPVKPVTHDFVVYDDASWISVFGQSDAALAGKTVAVAPGIYASKVLTNRPASTLTIIPHNPASPPELRNITIRGGKNIRIEGMKLTSPSTTNIVTVLSPTTNNKAENLFFYDCEAVGSFLGVIDNPALDTTDPRLPYYACVVPVFTGGVLSGIQTSTVYSSDGSIINLNYVGGLVPDGTGYSFTFQYAPSVGVTSGGVTWPGGAVKPVATFDVVGGVMQNFNIVSGGSGAVNEGTATLANGTYNSGNAMSCIQWSGRTPMIHMLPVAFAIDSVNGISESTNQVVAGTLRYEKVRVRMVRNAFKHQAAEIQEIVGCTVSKVYEDSASFQVAEGNLSFLFVNNTATEGFSADGHPDDPHADLGLQLFPNTTTGATKRVSPLKLTILGNFVINTVSWANSQGIFILMNYSQGTVPKVDGIIAYNAVLNRRSANPIYVDNAGDLIVHRNITRHSQANGSDQDIGVTALGIDIGSVSGTVVMSKNIAEAFPSTYGAGKLDNATYPNATTTGSAPFAAYSQPTSRADALSKLALSGVGQWTDANFGLFGGGYDFDATSVSTSIVVPPALIPAGATYALIGDGLTSPSSGVASGTANMAHEFARLIGPRLQPTPLPNLARSGTTIARDISTNRAWIYPRAIDAAAAQVPDVFIIANMGANDNLLSTNPGPNPASGATTNIYLQDWYDAVNYAYTKFAAYNGKLLAIMLTCPSAKAGEATYRTTVWNAMKAHVAAMTATDNRVVLADNSFMTDPSLYSIDSPLYVHLDERGAFACAQTIYNVIDSRVAPLSGDGACDMIDAGTYPLQSGPNLDTSTGLPGTGGAVTGPGITGSLATGKTLTNTTGATGITVAQVPTSGGRTKTVVTLAGTTSAAGKIMLQDTAAISVAATPGQPIRTGFILRANGYHNAGSEWNNNAGGWGGGATSIANAGFVGAAQTHGIDSVIFNGMVIGGNGTLNYNSSTTFTGKRSLALYYRSGTALSGVIEAERFFTYKLSNRTAGPPVYLGDLQDSGGGFLLGTSYRLRPTGTVTNAAGGTVRVEPGLMNLFGLTEADIVERRLYAGGGGGGVGNQDNLGAGTLIATLTGTAWTTVIATGALASTTQIFSEVDVDNGVGPPVTYRSSSFITVG